MDAIECQGTIDPCVDRPRHCFTHVVYKCVFVYPGFRLDRCFARVVYGCNRPVFVPGGKNLRVDTDYSSEVDCVCHDGYGCAGHVR